MKKLFLVLFAMVSLVACEVQDLFEDEPYEPMVEDFIREEVANPYGVVELNEEQARKIVEDYLDGINVNFSTGELEVIEDDLTELNYFRFEVYYKNVLLDRHKISLHPTMDISIGGFSTREVLIKGMSLFYNDISVKPRLSGKEALKYLKRSDSALTDDIIESQPKLLIYKVLGEAPYLAYRIRVDISMWERWDYYISAQTGEVLDISYRGGL